MRLCGGRRRSGSRRWKSRSPTARRCLIPPGRGTSTSCGSRHLMMTSLTRHQHRLDHWSLGWVNEWDPPDWMINMLWDKWRVVCPRTHNLTCIIVSYFPSYFYRLHILNTFSRAFTFILTNLRNLGSWMFRYVKVTESKDQHWFCCCGFNFPHSGPFLFSFGENILLTPAMWRFHHLKTSCTVNSAASWQRWPTFSLTVVVSVLFPWGHGVSTWVQQPASHTKSSLWLHKSRDLNQPSKCIV